MYPSYQIAIALIIQKVDRILLARRSQLQDFAAGIWEFPAGRVEHGENIEDAIVREAREELGIVITSHRILDAYTFNRDNVPMVLLTYTCTFEGEIRLSEEHDESRWVVPEEARDLLVFDLQKQTVDKFLQPR